MKVQFRYRFEAAHRLLQTDSKACMTPHGHTWYTTLSLKFIGQSLNSSQMTVEFSVLKKEWKALIQETFDHSYMHNISDPIIEVLQAGEIKPRLIPFPGDPTTEMIALFLFSKMHKIIETSEFKDRVQVDHILVDETPTNSIICSQDFFESQINNFSDHKGWWTSTDLKDRSLVAL